MSFRSASLNRDMPYRVFLPSGIGAERKLPVVYLLHGGGGGFHDWSNYSDVSRFCQRGLILVMPEGNSSYYTNASERAQDRYEDYIVHDLISEVESKFPTATGRGNRAIMGVSMGGFGAIKIGLRYPQLFGFAGGLSPALDVPSRPFSIKRFQQWRQHRSIFGPWQGQTQRENDPFELARKLDARGMPYLFLSCGEQEGLLPANKSFAALLDQRHFAHEFHAGPGGHDWNQWNGRLGVLFEGFFAHRG